MVLRNSFLSVAVGFALAWSAFSGSPASAEDELKRGAVLYGNCTQCHGPEGAGKELALAPSIAGFPQWYLVSQLQNFRSGARGLNPDDVGGLRMYPMSHTLRTDADVEAVSAYVASMPPAWPPHVVTGGNAEKGAEVYGPLCANCHGPDGAGNEQMKAPPLAGISDWYLLSAMRKYKAGIRGSNPANPFGPVMRSFAAQLDDQQILDLIAYIDTLSGKKN